ncbi:hypothetical protein AcW1_004687 [Taiwanofungus camphoratus]|nr:hypothetical protein AcW2_006309 [Antrodia cinnamomea]KAI0939768.1 hypothetical protein AcV5_001070 [Antrodia cinnamomea]KAI0952688.1 hypothetical protein AcV7_008401 [Antrodia cinnamomea]KAI0960058.1 hypothetical protein AcW1_004687 [Antrodia cinnamomea]
MVVVLVDQEELGDPYMLPLYHTLCILKNSSAMDVDKEDAGDTEGSSSSTEMSFIEQQETFEGIPTSSFTFDMPVSEALKHPYDDLPNLEEIIPGEYFPDILMVHDRLRVNTRPLPRASYSSLIPPASSISAFSLT